MPLSQKTADKLFGKIIWNNRLKRNILSNKIERGRDVKCQDIKSLVKNAKSTFQRKLFLFYSEWASRFRETAWNDVVLTNYPTIKSFRTDRRILNVFPNVCPIDWITLNLTVNRETSCFRLKTKKVVFNCCNYGNDYYFRMNWTLKVILGIMKVDINKDPLLFLFELHTSKWRTPAHKSGGERKGKEKEKEKENENTNKKQNKLNLQIKIYICRLFVRVCEKFMTIVYCT